MKDDNMMGKVECDEIVKVKIDYARKLLNV